jgi:hypothetical protein
LTPHHSLLLDYVWILQGQMMLQEWRIYIRTEEPAGEHIRAKIETFTSGSAEGWLSVSEDFWRCSPEAQRETIVHELLHLLLHDLRLASEAVIHTDYVPMEPGMMATEGIARAEERVVDRLSRVIAEDFKLPPAGNAAWRSGGNW